MRAAIFRNGEIVVDVLPEPKPGAGQVLVKTLACGICGSDLHARKHAHRMVELSRHFPGRKPMDLTRDVVFGHEFCCEILDYGAATQRKLKAGTRVCSLPALLTSDGPQGIGYSNDNVGGYAERMLLSEALLLEVPNGLAAEHAALTEPLAVGIHAVAKANVRGDEVPLVIGCGPVGLAVIAALKLKGLHRSSPRIIRRRAAHWRGGWAPTSSSIPRARSLMRPGPSTPRCRRSKRPRGRRCRRGGRP
jgi:threonine dehydrogenase-like Zn-dependent dehydrogenase